MYESTPVLTLKHNETAEIMAELKEQYGLENNTSISKLEELIKGRLSCGGDDFKRAFVLYYLSNFLTPTANSKVDFTAVKSLVNVGEIGYFDWSQYVLDKLCKAVSKYNKSTTQKNVSGCVLLLQILYFHRLKWRGIAQPSTLPLIQHWTHENLKQRMPEEISAGDFGQGELDNSTYPISSSKEMHEVFLLLKRDMSVITSVHTERVMKLKEQMKGKAPESSTQCQLSQDSQLFFRDSKVLEYVDQVVENFLAMKKLSEAMPSFDLLTPDEENDDQMANIAAKNDGDGGIEDYMLYLKNIVENLGDGEKNERHYFVVVINFGAKKVQCLDNRKHDQDTSAKYISAIKRLQLLMGKFLQSKSHKHAGDVLFFDIENVPFKWQTKRHDVDCGVYMMHHMSFSGEVYHTPDLSKVAIRRELRAEICSVIIWSPLNELAEDVKERVLDFCNKKSAQKKKNVREPRKKMVIDFRW
nr:uncharacterized protein LOC110792070 isoform X1 [Ipomoea batatas]